MRPMSEPPPRRTRGENLTSWISEKPNARGYYEAFVWMGRKGNGKPDRRRVQRKDLKSVRARVRELERLRDAGKPGKPGRPPTVQQMMERHLETILPNRMRAPRTVDDYWSKCRNDIFPLWGAQRADRLLPEQIQDGMAVMRKQGHAPAHIRKVLAILSSAYAAQIKAGALVSNPCKGVDFPVLPEPKRDSLTHAEAMAILAAAQGRPNAARWVIALCHGLRQGEALGITRDMVNLETGELRIWHQLQRLRWAHGCADAKACAAPHCKLKPCPRKCQAHTRACPPPCPKDCTGHAMHCPQRLLPPGTRQVSGALVLREIKERRRKTITLGPDFTHLLARHLDAQFLAATEADAEWENHGLVFAQWNGRPVDPRRDWGEWRSILEAAKLPPRRLHSLRHSAATFLIGEDVALPVVQKMLGHSDIRVTERYVSVDQEMMRRASDRMGASFLRGPSDTAGRESR